MKAKFLPKSLDGIGTRKYIVDHQTYRTKTELHWHDCIEMVYVEKGYMRIFLIMNGVKWLPAIWFLFHRKEFTV